VKANPKDGEAQDPQRQVADLNVEILLTIQERELQKTRTRCRRTWGWRTSRARRNKPVDSLKYLQPALQAAVGGRQQGDVQALMFNHYLWQKQFDKAEALLDPLARANQDESGRVLFRYRWRWRRKTTPRR
jgi:hypothetical protein